MSAAAKIVSVAKPEPKLVVMRGVGHRGKTTVARVLHYRAFKAGRAVTMADADRSTPKNPTLQRFFSEETEVNHPGDVAESEMYDWYADLVDQQAAASQTVIMDTAGGDHSFGQFVEEVDLPAMFAGLEVPIQLVQVLVLGPDPAEANILSPEERHGVRGGPNTIIMLNEGLADGALEGAVLFKKMLASEHYQAAVKAGSPSIYLPRLRFLTRINSENLSFAKAHKSYSLTGRSVIQAWLRRIDERVKPFEDRLP